MKEKNQEQDKSIKKSSKSEVIAHYLYDVNRERYDLLIKFDRRMKSNVILFEKKIKLSKVDWSNRNKNTDEKEAISSFFNKVGLNSDSEIVTFDEEKGIRSKRLNFSKARECEITCISWFLNENIGTSINPIETLDEYLHKVESIRKNNFSNNSFILFRGTPNDFNLCGRISYDASFTKYYWKNGESGRELKSDFVERIEKLILSVFEQRARPYTNKPIRSKWEAITLARHHSLPTRILDWSRDPLIGLWFSVTNQPQFRSRHSVVTMFNPDNQFLIAQEENEYSEFGTRCIVNSPFDLDNNYEVIGFEEEKNLVKGVALYRPASINPRIDSQSSWFTVHAFRKNDSTEEGSGSYQVLHTRYKKEDGKYYPLKSNDLDTRVNTFEPIKKIYIKSDKTHYIRGELSRIGINQAAVYQDLDNLGAYIKGAHFKLSDEVFSDESLSPSNVFNSFSQLQSNLALYNSEDVKSLQFMNVKGVYHKLLRLLSDENKKFKKFYTFNNMDRDFYSYGSQREIFLRVLEKKSEQKHLDYKRIQFSSKDGLSYIQKYIFEGDSIEDSIVKIVENTPASCLSSFFETFYVKTDNISRNHVVKAFVDTKNTNKVKYLFKKNVKETRFLSYVLLEYTMSNKSNEKEEDVYRHIILELNESNLPDIIGLEQDMVFWLELKHTKGNEKVKLFEEYESHFNKQYDQKTISLSETKVKRRKNRNPDFFSLDFMQSFLEKVKDKIIDDFDVVDDYKSRFLKLNIEIEHPLLDKTSAESKKITFLMDVSNVAVFYNLQSLLNYSYQRIKSSESFRNQLKEIGLLDVLSPLRITLERSLSQSGWFLFSADNKNIMRKVDDGFILEPKKDGYQGSTYEMFYLSPLAVLNIKNGTELKLVYKHQTTKT